MKAHQVINYLEFPARDMKATKTFFSNVFGWTFTDFGPDYTAFSEGSVDGGFYHASLYSSTVSGAALTVFYSNNLEATQASIEAAGGKIVKAIFDFPGGRRFHFYEPSGNEFAVWSDQ